MSYFYLAVILIMGLATGYAVHIADATDLKPEARAEILLDAERPQINIYVGGHKIANITWTDGRVRMQGDPDDIKDTLEKVHDLLEAIGVE